VEKKSEVVSTKESDDDSEDSNGQESSSQEEEEREMNPKTRDLVEKQLVKYPVLSYDSAVNHCVSFLLDAGFQPGMLATSLDVLEAQDEAYSHSAQSHMVFRKNVIRSAFAELAKFGQ